ncbi:MULTISPECIES: pyrroline-5-carboxylate reductase [unclassified Bartonella]|uniref:pyrroline-5-carboxylate reductase n=1 Tax=unclassified Bartonella TaxID=2645622 RepID=UPI0009992C88|nr:MULTISPECIES: pyrroline-5-carboxylate reductase [unclassified Bartonella]AQX27555.1 pyrroline-5-carboxylate reductase [Bartonella sp. JB15]AQX28834.1 pyrroline-5-carboxylate reductase [Bartonella sp. JB63]
MRIGFLGTGKISAAMVDGLMASTFDVQSIIVSPRNAQRAEHLARVYEKVTIAESNQKLLDVSDCVFLCLRNQIAEEVLRSLYFRSDQLVVSVLAMASMVEIEEWINHKVYRAIPLPFIAECKNITPIYPDHPFLRAMFNALGGALVLNEEDQFNLFMIAGSLMGVYFNFIETAHQWLVKKGLDPLYSADFLAMMFGNLADEMRKAKAVNHSTAVNFSYLEREFSTKGGTNELLSDCFSHQGGQRALTMALERTLQKIKGLSTN